MTRSLSIGIQSLILLWGLALWFLLGRSLHSKPALDVPLNVMGINRSPYGEVLALAIQGPIDQSFKVGMFGISRQKPALTGFDFENPDTRFSIRGLLSQFESASKASTTNKPTSEAHKRYLRKQAEDQLRFAYQLDPAQYSNYNSLHFFLTEPAVGTSKTITPEAEILARETIQYCLANEHDPRPALTAAAACTNMLQLMFADRKLGRKNHSTGEMREMLQTLDQSIQRYETLAAQWEENGGWELLSEQRINECLDRIQFIRKIRNASAAAINRMESAEPKP